MTETNEEPPVPEESPADDLEARAVRSRQRRLKTLLLVIAVLANALILAAWTQSWLSISLVGVGPHSGALDVVGSVAAPALSALALAGLALVAALAIAGPVFRIILGVLEAVIGVCVAISAITVLTAPATAGAAAVTEATGVAGNQSTVDLVAATSLTAWPAVALVLGIVLGLAGLATAVTHRMWPGPSRKYQAVRFTQVEASPSADPVGAWDDLSRGDDPTR
ncbi:Trp biosynthesis-associated membrane protein [Plantibacter sp. VKM Ac-2880]|uniref:Trp biosynthesis-associated membrane protein n=1 Tax=Plantibacter sp. VKM Ac-2880 TaxID=2783827 RepID=UPI0018906DAA|nr:Trp biosynthesis-associated membrane protein [Plantibacter sp. VKM Ac-2880]MBF4569287.1 Trp biosynthesis-associated membrane protein [Plantibacter sp. VKM Ac-2880]